MNSVLSEDDKMSLPVLEASHLELSYKSERADIHVLRGISLEVGRGETIAIVGESGCGKSTLARVLVGLEKPDKGSVKKTSGKIIPMVFQDSLGSLNPRRSVEEIIAEPILIKKGRLRLKEGEITKIHELARRVGLEKEYFHKFPHELSGGQRQRVNIARALAAEAEVLVLDEPLSALDVSIQAQIINLLVEIQRREKLALIFISHDLSVVRYLAHRVLVLYLGTVVEEGATDVIMTRPGHPYTRTLLASDLTNGYDGEGFSGQDFSAQGEPPSPYEIQTGCVFSKRCPLADEHCKKEIPALEHLGDGRKIACFKHKETLS